MCLNRSLRQVVSVLSISHFRFGYFFPTERVHLISDMVDFYGV
jgi:hypothetical protein